MSEDKTDRIIYWVALKNIPGVGTYRCKKLLDFFGKPEKVFEASFNDLTEVEGIGNFIANFVKEKKKLLEDAKREIEEAKERGIDIICLDDEFYPDLLKKISDPPPVLYIKGSFELADNNAIGIIGTRKPDNYGKNVAGRFAAKLAGCKFTIVSGMARGIDSFAHRGAIEAGGRTIAVLGCGVDVVYPPENKKLMEEIVSSGAVISEFPPGTEPHGGNFPQRNRIISGMARGVLVVQAREKSGTFHTVNAALEQGREVFAIPGPIDKELSRGTHNLIKSGAKLVENIEDILEELGPMDISSHFQGDLFSEEKAIIETPSPDLSEKEKIVYSIIAKKKEGLHIDEIIREGLLSTREVTSVLSFLEIKGIIKRLKGNLFTLNV